jgi:hypothetical protein
MNRTLLGIVAAALLALGVQTCRLARASAAGDRNAARADSAIAANDTTRLVVAVKEVLKAYGPDMQAVERRALQVAPKVDALDKKLDRISVATAQFALGIRRLEALAAGAGVTTDTATGERTDTFNVRQPPYTVGARATLPATGAGRLSLGVALDDAHLGVRVQCGEAVGGFRPATVLLAAPTWLTTRIDSLRQAPGVCNPERPRRWYDGRLTFGPSVNVSFVRDTAAKFGRRLNTSFGFSGQLGWFRWP